MPSNNNKTPNRLINEKSPYLQQHAYNPVDWYPWGDEAIKRARELDRPIFLSIGYSACHWCHVMERESFDNVETASFLNDHFVCIKVDREERPDIDEVYMQAAQMMTGGGGWPLSVFLDSELKPFYSGTYFPPVDMYGRPGFPKILQSIVNAYRDRRDDIAKSASELANAISQSLESLAQPGEVSLDLVDRAAKDISTEYDPVCGGFGDAPKFPPSFALRLLLRSDHRHAIPDYRQMVEKTLSAMIRGGIFDQVGGGFHRYSTDRQWLVPHFEKMLYDNALMVVALCEAWQVTERDDFVDAVSRTLDFVMRELTAPDGSFYSALDADSEGEEGKFYVWTPEEIVEILGEDDGTLFCRIHNITPAGNFERGSSIPNLTSELKDWCILNGFELTDINRRLSAMRKKLLKARNLRIRPHLDDKVIIGWNALMISALSFAGFVFNNGSYTQAAIRAAETVQSHHCNGRLPHCLKDGQPLAPAAFQEDYACLVNALVDLYQATFDARWIMWAESLAGEMIDKFWDERSGGFYFAENSHATPLARSKSPTDGVTPSGNSMAALGLSRLSRLNGNLDIAKRAEETLNAVGGVSMRAPRAFEHLLIAADFIRSAPREIALAGGVGNPDYEAMLDVLRHRFLPSTVIAGVFADSSGIPAVAQAKQIPADGAAAYLCSGFACKAPIFTAEDLSSAL